MTELLLVVYLVFGFVYAVELDRKLWKLGWHPDTPEGLGHLIQGGLTWPIMVILQCLRGLPKSAGHAEGVKAPIPKL